MLAPIPFPQQILPLARSCGDQATRTICGLVDVIRRVVCMTPGRTCLFRQGGLLETCLVMLEELDKFHLPWGGPQRVFPLNPRSGVAFPLTEKPNIAKLVLRMGEHRTSGRWGDKSWRFVNSSKCCFAEATAEVAGFENGVVYLFRTRGSGRACGPGVRRPTWRLSPGRPSPVPSQACCVDTGGLS